MKKVIIKVSDIKKQNTTQMKIRKTLSKYPLDKIDKVIFYIEDMFYPPKEREQWRKILIRLQRLVFDATYYKEMPYDDIYYIDIPEVEIKFGKQMKKTYIDSPLSIYIF